MMKLATRLGILLLTSSSPASAQDALPPNCTGPAGITGGGAIFDAPGGVQIGEGDPSNIYLWRQRRIIGDETWYELRRDGIVVGWLKATTANSIPIDPECHLAQMRLTGLFLCPFPLSPSTVVRWNGDFRKSRAQPEGK
jgi:hypothetical protein